MVEESETRIIEDDNFKITVLYGVKILEPVKYRLYRVKGRRTLFNWFPEDEGRLESDFMVMSGIGYDDMIEHCLAAGIRPEIVNELYY